MNMKITKKNYSDVFCALLKHFDITGFCVQHETNLYTSAPAILCNENTLIGVINEHKGGPFVMPDGNYFMPSCLNEIITKCPIEFKNHAVLSLNDIAFYCRVKDINEMLLKFTQEVFVKLCKNTVSFNNKTYEKISLEELLVEADLK